LNFGRPGTRIKNQMVSSTDRMTKSLFSRQEVIELLSQLKDIHTKYPPEFLSARRRTFLFLAAQLAAARSIPGSRKKQWGFLITQEPIAIIMKALIVVFVAFLIAFLAHAIASGNINFE